MTSTFDIDEIFERLLAKAELEYESERKRVERMLAECGTSKTQPAKDYWHKLENLRRKVNTYREITEHDRVKPQR